MNKIREIVIFIFLGLIFLTLLIVIILLMTGTIDLYFSTHTMSIFSKISKISLYVLVGILFINSFLPYLVKRHKQRLSNIVLSLVYFLLAVTIISVEVEIWIWVLAVGLTLLLSLTSIIDVFLLSE